MPDRPYRTTDCVSIVVMELMVGGVLSWSRRLAGGHERVASLTGRPRGHGQWIGARVAHLREHADDSACKVEAEPARKDESLLISRKRAEVIAMALPKFAGSIQGLDLDHRNLLLERALMRLREPSEVMRHLKDVEQLRDRLIESEVVRETLEKELDSMSDGDFASLCSRFFANNSGLKRFYVNGNRSSTGFRLHLLAFMAAATFSEPTRMVGKVACERTASLFDTPAALDACTDPPCRSSPCVQAIASPRRSTCLVENRTPSPQDV